MRGRQQHRQKFDDLRRQLDTLSPDQRNKVRQAMREARARSVDQMVDAYFALLTKERVVFLDKQIDRIEIGARNSTHGTNRQVGGKPTFVDRVAESHRMKLAAIPMYHHNYAAKRLTIPRPSRRQS